MEMKLIKNRIKNETMPKKLISYSAIWIKSVCQQCDKTSMKLK